MSDTFVHSVIYQDGNVIHEEVPQQHSLGGSVQLVGDALHCPVLCQQRLVITGINKNDHHIVWSFTSLFQIPCSLT